MDGFLSNGFSVGNGSGSNRTNFNSANYVAWCWKAGGAAVTNNNGSVTSQVSANKDAGFSIVTYTGSNDSTVTFGHGLNSAPEVVFIKRRNNANRDRVYHHSVGLGKYLSTSNENAANTSAQDFASVSSTTFGVKGGYNPVSINGGTYVAYCWHSVPGYSLFGEYYGNGSSDGKFVYTGFKPAMIITKRKDGTDSWQIWDNKRDVDNLMHHRLFPNENSSATTTVSSSSSQLDFYSTGFKWKGSSNDTNGGDLLYVYMAFAEQPAVNQYGSQSNER